MIYAATFAYERERTHAMRHAAIAGRRRLLISQPPQAIADAVEHGRDLICRRPGITTFGLDSDRRGGHERWRLLCYQLEGKGDCAMGSLRVDTQDEELFS
eukprot:2688798-Pleurochrysis_carterae.AAC.1